jgi:hypothetical protein
VIWALFPGEQLAGIGAIGFRQKDGSDHRVSSVSAAELNGSTHPKRRLARFHHEVGEVGASD